MNKININNAYYFIIISILFFIIHLITITSSTLPWIDEVMFIDLPVNVIQNNILQTTAYAAKNGVTPFPTYPPLYSFLIFLWIKLFGFSIFSVRSFNILLILLLSFLGLSYLDKSKSSNRTKLLFLLLLWFSSTFIWIFKNGRVDTLNLFLCSLYVYTSVYFNSKRFLKIILITLIILSGIQASLFIFLFLFWEFLFKIKDFKNSINDFKCYFIGTLLGFFIMLIFFIINNQTFPFLSFIISSASGVKKITILLLNFLNIRGYDISKLNHSSFKFDILNSITQNNEFLVLFAIVTFVLSFMLINKKIEIFSLEIKIFLFIILIIFIYTFSGHFIIYYTWMIYIPIIILFLILFQKFNDNLFFIIVFFIAYCGINKQIINSKKSIEIENINAFLNKKIKKNNLVVLATFNSYYSIKKITNKVYFPGIYPVHLLPETIDYIIYSKEEFGSANLLNIINKNYQKNKIEKIDSIITPNLYLYKIKK